VKTEQLHEAEQAIIFGFCKYLAFQRLASLSLHRNAPPAPYDGIGQAESIKISWLWLKKVM
jgi:hypothetical protein